jgi:uncharacterized protein YndB with AHSA1/START domain
MNPTSASKTIVAEITIAAPAERIFEALADPDQRAKWWGGDRFQTTTMESDLRVGGKWAMHGVSMGDKPFVIRGEYRLIERPKAIAFTWLPSFVPNAQETFVRFDLEETAGRTLVRVTHSSLTDESLRGHNGWPDILAYLQGFVEKA